MSRSFKRPFVKDKPTNRWKEKRFAAKAARRSDYDDGCHYKRMYPQYRLDDGTWYWPTEEARRK